MCIKAKSHSLKAGILEGIRVLDLTRMLSGPYATMLLADHGAEVIKIESAEGDSSRRSGPFKEDDLKRHWSGYFISLNRNKKSISLNLKNENDLAFFKKLIEKSDVLVENFRPGVMNRLGLSFDEVSKINPRIVYGSISGFGSDIFGESPYKNWPSYDVVAQAMGGLISLTGYDEENPLKVGPGIADIFSGSLLSFGLLASILKARDTGRAQFVEVAMYDAIISMCERAIYQYDFNNVIPKPEGNGHPLLAPFGIYKAKDGFIAIGIVEDSYWNILKKIIATDEILNDVKYGTISLRARNRKELNEKINIWTERFSKKELVNLLGGKVPFGPVNNVKEIFEDKHVTKRDMIFEIEHPSSEEKIWKVAGNPVKFKGFRSFNLTPPVLGEHKELYVTNLDSINSNNPRHSFQPQQKDYQCKVTFSNKNNEVLELYACSFTWLKSSGTYLICSVRKSDFMAFENCFSSVKFHFLKVIAENDSYEDVVNSLNIKLSNKDITDVSIIDTKVEILLSVKT